MSDVTISRKTAEVPLVMTIDVGSSSVRTMLFDRLGRAIEGMLIREGYPINTPEKGAAEIDPDLLLDRLFRCIDRILTQSGSLGDKISGIGISTLVSNILGIDEKGRAITPVYTYADTRADSEAAALRLELNEGEVHNRTGCRLHTSYLPARLLWLHRTRSDTFHRIKRWLTIGEYIFYRVFGRAKVSYSVASWSGLLDRVRLVWDEPLLAVLPINTDQLSPLIDADQPFSGLNARFSDRWPALRNIPWFPAIGDGAAANMGTGCISPRRIALSMGTSSALRVLTTQRAEDLPSSLWCYQLDRLRTLVGGALTEGGNILDWMTKVLKVAKAPDLDAALAVMVPDSHGLTILPFLGGERSPGWAGSIQGAIHGLSLSTTSLDILRAGLEAVALRLTLVRDDLVRVFPEAAQVIASGGAFTHCPSWLQIIADALGQPVAASSVTEASSRGVALFALEALGVVPDGSSLPDSVKSIYEPDFEHHQRYRSALNRQQDLYRKLIRTWAD